MLFQETWKYLQEGYCVKRGKSTNYVFLLPKIDNLYFIDSEISKDNHPTYFAPTIQDLLASDWDVVEY